MKLLLAVVLAVLPFTVLSVTPDVALTDAMKRDHGWLGADGAHSYALGPDTAVWVFGDTLFGDDRATARMVHNSAAIRTADGFHFYQTAGDLLSPTEAGEWYWPGDGYVADGRLHLFCMRVRKAPGPYGFDFAWYATDLLTIDNPGAPAGEWRVSARESCPPHDGVLLGAACAVSDGRVYAWGLQPDDRTRTLFLATRALSGGPWTWHGAAFDHGAPEMSITRLDGEFRGCLAVCSPDGLSNDVALRWAPSPEGPWSAPQVVYRARESLWVYGARAHPELSTRDEIVLTYNTNAPDPGVLRTDPDAYHPRFIRVRVGRSAGATARVCQDRR